MSVAHHSWLYWDSKIKDSGKSQAWVQILALSCIRHENPVDLHYFDVLEAPSSDIWDNNYSDSQQRLVVNIKRDYSCSSTYIISGRAICGDFCVLLCFYRASCVSFSVCLLMTSLSCRLPSPVYRGTGVSFAASLCAPATSLLGAQWRLIHSKCAQTPALI